MVLDRKAPADYTIGGITIMDQVMLSAVCRTIVGRTGRRLPAYTDICEAYTKGLFADYYLYNPMVSTKTYYKYANAAVPFPHFLNRHYSGASGYRRTLSDMMGICDACRREIAIFLGDVMHRAICQENVGYRPTDTGTSL